MLRSGCTALLIAALTCVHTTRAQSPAAPVSEPQLIRGDLPAAEDAVRTALGKSPTNDNLRFELGVVQFLRANERLLQELYRHGFGASRDLTGVLAMAGPPFVISQSLVKPDPAETTYDDIRKMVSQFATDCAAAERTLAEIRSDAVRLPLRVARIGFDIDRNGKATDPERLWAYVAAVAEQFGGAGAAIRAVKAEEFVIVFDRADVEWLRGYCHLLLAGAEFFLAYDEHDLYDHMGYQFFARMKSDHPPVPRHEADPWFDGILDLIAVVHLVNFPVSEPERMKFVLEHLQSAARHSRAMWKYILVESDDDNEWICAPRQTSVISGVRITPEMVHNWTAALDEVEALLAGRKLLPFWRGNTGQGVNLRRVFLEPRRLDLVLWVQGSAAVPYLESGELTTPESWTRIQSVFGDNFFAFAAWFN